MAIKCLLFLSFYGFLVMANPVADVTSPGSPINKLSLPFLASLDKTSGVNYAYSPLSLATALGLLKEGADGSTLAKVNEFFANQDVSETLKKIDQKSANSVDSKLKSANLVIHRNDVTLKDAFKSNILSKYHAGIETFEQSKLEEALKRVNKFVSDNTLNLIPKIFDSLPAQSLLVLVNAVSLDAKWTKPFEKFKTRVTVFHGDKGDKDVDFMVDERSINHHHCQGKKLQLIEIPYKDDLSMIIVLPDDVKGLDSVLSNLTDNELEQRIWKLKSTYVELQLPKFQVESTYDLIPILTKLGLGDLFGASANYNNMLSTNTAISQAAHKTVVKVDEDGTKAAAATGFNAIATSAIVGLKEIKIDRPFLFIIREPSTKSNLFVGIIRNI